MEPDKSKELGIPLTEAEIREHFPFVYGANPTNATFKEARKYTKEEWEIVKKSYGDE